MAMYIASMVPGGWPDVSDEMVTHGESMFFLISYCTPQKLSETDKLQWAGVAERWKVLSYMYLDLIQLS